MPPADLRSCMTPGSPIEIQAQGLTKAFGDHVVLNSIDLTIRTGEVVAIVGGSGSGKTVLLDHLTGLIQPDSGRILAADHNEPTDSTGQCPLVDLQQADSDKLDLLRLHWSVVFQRNALFSGTVRENIALWLREHTSLSEDEIEHRICESVQAVQLDQKNILDKERDELSGGMAKRVAIARAIATDPIVMFYDEPTSGLDPVVGGAIHELIWTTHHKPVGPRPNGPSIPPTLLSRIADRLPSVEEMLLDVTLQIGFPHRHTPTPPGQRSETPVPSALQAAQPPRTTVIVTHDKELLRRLRPRVVMLNHGGVCFDGPYERFGQDDCAPARAYLETMPVLHASRNQGK